MSFNQTFRETHDLVLWSFDTSVVGSNTLTNVNSTAWIDMQDYGRITALILRLGGSGAIQDARFYASAASTGTSAEAVGTALGSATATGILTDTDIGGSIGNVGGGYAIVEVSQDEIAATIEGGRYVNLRLSSATNANIFGVVYILSEPRYKQANLLATDGTQAG